MLTGKLGTGIVSSVILACVVLVAVALYADAPQMIVTLVHFRWEYLPLILGLTLFNYFWRFVKWQYYLRCLKVGIRSWKSLLIFVAGLSMAITPGKVGELLKAYLLKREVGAGMSHTAPIIVAERLTDGIAMLMLAATGLVFYRFGWEVLLMLLLLGLTGIGFVQSRRLVLTLFGFGERLPTVSRFVHLARIFYESTYTLLRWRPLLLAIVIGLVSWLGECGALYVVFMGLGVAPSVDLLIKATFILAFASLVGSASGLPGGLGAAEGSVLALTRLLVSPSVVLGGTATLLIRFCTLWFGVGLGAIALLMFQATGHTTFLRGRGNGEGLREHTDGMRPLEDDQSGLCTESVSGRHV